MVRMGGRAMPFSAFSPGPQIDLGWRFNWRYAFVEPRLSLSSGHLLAQPSVLLFEADAGASAGVQLPVGPLRVTSGIDTGLVLPQQASMSQLFGAQYWSSPTGLLSFALQGKVFSELAFQMPGGIDVLGRVYGGVSVYKLGDRLILPPTVGSALGVAYRF